MPLSGDARRSLIGRTSGAEAAVRAIGNRAPTLRLLCRRTSGCRQEVPETSPAAAGIGAQSVRRRGRHSRVGMYALRARSGHLDFRLDSRRTGTWRLHVGSSGGGSAAGAAIRSVVIEHRGFALCREGLREVPNLRRPSGPGVPSAHGASLGPIEPTGLRRDARGGVHGAPPRAYGSVRHARVSDVYCGNTLKNGSDLIVLAMSGSFTSKSAVFAMSFPSLE